MHAPPAVGEPFSATSRCPCGPIKCHEGSRSDECRVVMAEPASNRLLDTLGHGMLASSMLYYSTNVRDLYVLIANFNILGVGFCLLCELYLVSLWASGGRNPEDSSELGLDKVETSGGVWRCVRTRALELSWLVCYTGCARERMLTCASYRIEQDPGILTRKGTHACAIRW